MVLCEFSDLYGAYQSISNMRYLIVALFVSGCWSTHSPMQPLVPEPPPYCYSQDYRDVEYICEDLGECDNVEFQCEEGENPFFDDCGCGCMEKR